MTAIWSPPNLYLPAALLTARTLPPDQDTLSLPCPACRGRHPHRRSDLIEARCGDIPLAILARLLNCPGR